MCSWGFSILLPWTQTPIFIQQAHQTHIHVILSHTCVQVRTDPGSPGLLEALGWSCLYLPLPPPSLLHTSLLPGSVSFPLSDSFGFLTKIHSGNVVSPHFLPLLRAVMPINNAVRPAVKRFRNKTPGSWARAGLRQTLPPCQDIMSFFSPE